MFFKKKKILNQTLPEPAAKTEAPVPVILYFNHYKNTFHHFGIKTEWKRADEAQMLHHQVQMYCREGEQGQTIWEISKQHFFINEYKPENPMYMLAIACAESFYPIQFSITNSGILDRVINTKELIARFAKQKPVLLQDFGGAIAEKYIHQTETAIQQPQQLAKLIQHDIWLSLFFLPYYGPYSYGDNTQPVNVTLPWQGTKGNLVFTGKLTLDRAKTEWGTNIAVFNGSISPSSENINGNLEITCHLDAVSHHIVNITCTADVHINNEDNVLNMSGYEIINEHTATKKRQAEGKDKWTILVENNHH